MATFINSYLSIFLSGALFTLLAIIDTQSIGQYTIQTILGTGLWLVFIILREHIKKRKKIIKPKK
jgi:hypothetical protein